jgi:hypothetical protein
LPEAIESVLEQTVEDWELIVVDDGSTDETETVVAGYLRDPRVRYCKQRRSGRSAARNRGVGLARGQLIAFLDSDDRYRPAALAAHLEVLRSRAGVGITIGGYEYIDETGLVVGERRPWATGGALTLEGWVFDCYGIPGSIMLRREWFERCGGFDRATEMAEDWDLFLRLAFAGCEMDWTGTIVCQYRQHVGNSIHDFAKQRCGATAALDKLFGQAGLPEAVAALERGARASAVMGVARRAAAVGSDDFVREALRSEGELRRTPRWQRRGGSFAPLGLASLLEPLVRDAATREADGSDRKAALADLPARWNVRTVEIRRALARVEMRQFFECVQLGDRTEAAAHLRAGLRDDPRWLANRGVVAFLLRRPFSR